MGHATRIVFGLLAIAGKAAWAESAATPTGALVFAAHVRSAARTVRPAVHDAIAGARERLARSECLGVLGEFEAATGVTLGQNLAVLSPSAADYLSLVLFVDGSNEPRCVMSPVVAWTQVGSRVVRICGTKFAERRQIDPASTEITIIHEALHTLGLGENPHSSREITRRIEKRCR